MLYLLNLARVRYFPCLLILLTISLGAAAQVQIKGKVTDAQGNTLPQITVSLQNTNYSTATDASGNYSLNANVQPGSHLLIFSGIGFKSTTQSVQVSSGGDNTLNVQLSTDPLNLDEVVVTGVSAGTTRRQLGNYISSVKGEELTKGATGNVLAALQGKTAGAQISQNSGDPAG